MGFFILSEQTAYGREWRDAQRALLLRTGFMGGVLDIYSSLRVEDAGDREAVKSARELVPKVYRQKVSS